MNDKAATGQSTGWPQAVRTASALTSGPPRAVLLAVVVFVSIVVRVIHLVSIYPTPSFSHYRTWTGSDMHTFNEWAGRIVNGDLLGREPFNPTRDGLAKFLPAGRWKEWFGDAPVFLKAPLYPYLIALLRWSFGDAMLPVAILQILAAAGCAVLLFVITEHVFDRASGFVAALLFALYAPGIHYDVVMLRGPWIVLASVLITWQLIRLQQRPTGRAGWMLGVAVGMAMVLNEGFVTLPVLTLAIVAWLVRDRWRFAVLSANFAFGCLLAFAPVIVRNLIVGVPPFQLAVTGTYGLAMTNAGDAEPVFFQFPPGASFLPLMEASGGKLLNLVLPCLRSFSGLEAFLSLYLRRAAGLIIPFENPDNANFYYAALRSPVLRALPTYALVFPVGVLGLALAVQRRQKLRPLLPASLALLISIMITLPMSRYRVTLTAFLFPFCGLALVQAARWLRALRFVALAIGISVIVLVSVAVHLVERDITFKNREPTSVTYRPAEFNLAAKAYAQQKRFREATRELLDLAQLCHVPAEQAGALARAARMQIQGGDPTEARASLRAAFEIADSSPAVLLTIGDTYAQMLGDADSARQAYQRLHRLTPTGRLGDLARARLALLTTR